MADTERLQIISGIRTDDIAAAYIIFRTLRIYGLTMRTPDFRTASSDRYLILREPFCTVGIPLAGDKFLECVGQSVFARLPVYYDNHRDSYKFLAEKGAAVTKGDSLAELVGGTFELLTAGTEKEAEVADMLATVRPVADMIANSMNLSTMDGYSQRIKALPFVYSPFELLASGFGCISGRFESLLSSPLVDKYMKLQKDRIGDGWLSAKVLKFDGGYTCAMIRGYALLAEDTDNACADYFAANPELNAVVIPDWDRRFKDYPQNIFIRTRNGEAEPFAKKIAEGLGEGNSLTMLDTANRSEVFVRNLPHRLKTKSSFFSKLLEPAAASVAEGNVQDAPGAGQ